MRAVSYCNYRLFNLNKKDSVMSKPPTNHEALASVAEVATYLHVAEVTVRRKIKSTELPATRIGNRLRMRWVNVYALEAHGTVAPTT